jgi:hypothetical protein
VGPRFAPTAGAKSGDHTQLLDYEQGKDLDGYLWGVNWHVLYPGIQLLDSSPSAEHWSAELGMTFYEATVETNAHNAALVFSDLAVDTVPPGHAPFVVPEGGPDFKWPIL